MQEGKLKPVIYEVEYGTINLKLNDIMEKRNISIYELSSKANIRFQTIKSIKENTATRIDFDVLAKICFALDCKVEDLIEYINN